MSYMEFWARAFCARSTWTRDFEHAASYADAALVLFKQRFPAEAEAPGVAREIKERIAAGDAPDWAK